MVSDVLALVTVMNFKGEIKRYTTEEIGCGYRQSMFQSDHSIVFSARMDLRKDDYGKIRERLNEYIEWRKVNQPLDLPNAGSIFKNPSGVSAGQVIDMAGLKGLRIGGAKISEKRANFIVNLGNATGNDVLTLMDIAKEAVFRKFGIVLEPEIRIVGRLQRHSASGNQG
jgi:UDP-N-acetylmuramate dehydrogenase